MLASGWALTGCSAGSSTSGTAEGSDAGDAAAAAALVRDYLDAISAGDAEAAHALDEHLLSDSAYADRDVTTLLTDEALQGAERIEGVEVDEPDASEIGTRTVRVSYEYTLDDAPYAGALRVQRDDAGAWELAEPLAGALLVQVEAADGSKRPVGFSVPGAEYSPDPSAERPQLVTAYPAVYEVTATLPEGSLADGAESTQSVVLGEVDGVYATFAVTSLPAS
ncbi:hypothetical protein SCB71_04770 [Herbiconiux sp. KACC 21604]|uniref:hypothetical protein n=1 Tax=unclassified Herbiconiux TaxID=2618217 RepID=UPI001491A40D|nr:hypothetical protein [Herbiconiux sp. SALV-R1]QJU52664.1 hypothetical protein HL652_02745 [Herbiconiux sp. SALV-R1]WPO87560.1 hypothetical protein SCB71_04770 [Herbiconiux sp. KACC 21604]